MKMAHRLDRDQQIAHVRRYGESSLLAWVAAGCAVVLVLGIGLFNHFERELPKVLSLFAAGVCGLVGLALVAQLPELRRAARATRNGRRVHGMLALDVDRSDSDATRYRGTLREGTATWVLHFGNPMGWEPQSGSWPCVLVFLAGEPGPSLAMLDDGLLFPTARSRREYAQRA